MRRQKGRHGHETRDKKYSMHKKNNKGNAGGPPAQKHTLFTIRSGNKVEPDKPASARFRAVGQRHVNHHYLAYVQMVITGEATDPKAQHDTCDRCSPNRSCNSHHVIPATHQPQRHATTECSHARLAEGIPWPDAHRPSSRAHNPSLADRSTPFAANCPPPAARCPSLTA